MPDFAAELDSLTLRPPEQVMRLSRLGALHQSRLSFMRQLTRRMSGPDWSFTCAEWSVDHTGVGHAVYLAKGPNHTYALVAFAHDLPPEARSDRVIAEAWDATFALFDGVPSAAEIARLAANVPVQEAGRVSATELTLSRANRSVRLWATVVDALSKGHQPDRTELEKIGYLMRTTAVYGSGKFGAADREAIADRPEFQNPFQAEMLTVYLIRTFVRDLVNHMAKAKGGASAVSLDPDAARSLGIGNSTGLGMAPFIVNHPILFNNWITARETAIARVRAVKTATPEAKELFRNVLDGARQTVANWRTESPYLVDRVAILRAELDQVEAATQNLPDTHPWDALLRFTEESLSEEAQECVASLILEPYPDLVDDLCGTMSDDRPGYFPIDGRMTLDTLRRSIEARYDWALDVDWAQDNTTARVWYVSEEKLEPRLGERADEPLDAYEEPLAPGRDVARLYQAIADQPDETPIAELLLAHPEHRHAVRRIQATDGAGYAEIRDNTVGASVLPIDMLRAKLSFFGATGFDPRSDRWVRICMFAGAPYPDELTEENCDLWVYPGVTGNGA